MIRTIALEEHVVFPEFSKKIILESGTHSNRSSGSVANLSEQLADVTGERLAAMDAAGISTQVLSVVGPGANLLHGDAAVRTALEYNDTLAKNISGYPDRFAAFAHLPTTEPNAAANELERAVKVHHFCGAMINGMTDDKFLDDPEFAPILEKAQQLDVPIYLHPGLPPEPVVKAYYSNLPKESGERLSVAGWGWHSETAIHVLRLIISGTFDKYANLKLIIGHMGEMLPMMMARCDTMFKPGEAGVNQRSISQTLKDQVFITTSGMFTKPPFQIALETLGVDRILFSVDYPFATNDNGRQFLDNLHLSDKDMEKLCWRNAAQLLKLPAEQ
jgi:predicted TIM-barrel fold metal-dependent hydrolase